MSDGGSKSASPTSNSITSISPGSSVGGIQRPPSNTEEADSESDDKEVVQTTNKGSIDIMDLLCKAQNKYEKEKRNTPDPTTETLQNGNIKSPTEPRPPLVKPVPMKPTHPQKLDVASLFKQQPTKPPDSTIRQNISQQQTNSIVTAPILPPQAMAPLYTSMINAQQMVSNTMQQSASISIPSQQRRPHMPRSFSMTDMAMRQQVIGMKPYMNGAVMSVEEVEASLNSGSITTHQQQVNSKLDKLIDRINSTGGLPSTTSNGSSQAPSLPGIQENSHRIPQSMTVTGNSGSLVVNGNAVNTMYAGDDIFTSVEGVQPFPSAISRIPNPVHLNSNGTGTRQRSISTSVLHTSHPGLPGTAQMVPVTSLARNFPPAANQIKAPYQPLTTPNVTFPAAPPQNSLPIKNDRNVLLQGTAPALRSPGKNFLASSVTTAASFVQSDPSNVQVTSPSNVPSVNSPAVTATLISPEDFELSASTPQKKLELKNRLLRELTPVSQSQANVTMSNPTAPDQISKEQLQQTLVSLLMNDRSFLDKIHAAYLANLKQT